jgi:hypothetical protein
VKLLALSVLFASVLIATGCSTTASPRPGESAETAVKRQFDLYVAGDYARYWLELHPGQRTFVTKSKFEECSAKSPLTATSFSIVDSMEGATVFSTGVPDSRATAIRVDQETNRGKGRVVYYEVSVEGRWYWVLNPAGADAYRRGTCPTDGQ